MKENVKKIIDDHWKWLEGFLFTIEPSCPDLNIDVIEYVYKTAFEHGYKHGIESILKDNSGRLIEDLIKK